MSDEQNESNSWPDHKQGPWPDYVKELIVSMWTSGAQPGKIANLINGMDVLARPITGHSVSQFLSEQKKKNPEILDQRKESKQELVAAAKELAPQIRQNVIGRMKEATLQVVSEVQDAQPGVIRDIIQQLQVADSPQKLRELSTSLNIQMNILERISGLDAARKLAIYEEMRKIDQKYRASKEDGEDAKNITPNVVDVEGWDGP